MNLFVAPDADVCCQCGVHNENEGLLLSLRQIYVCMRALALVLLLLVTFTCTAMISLFKNGILKAWLSHAICCMLSVCVREREIFICTFCIGC